MIASTIRPARADEAASLAELHVVCWQEAYVGLLPDDFLARLTPAARLPYWEQVLGTEEGLARTFVAESDGELIGFAGFSPSRDGDAKGETAELLYIYVRQFAWGQKVGYCLCETSADACNATGFEEWTLWVHHQNLRAINFYKRFGFRGDTAPEAVKVEEIRGTLIREIRFRQALPFRPMS